MRKMNKKKPKAIVLFSGGLDSATLLYYVARDFNPVCLTFNYNQRHKKEINCAKEIARRLNVRLIVLDVPFPDIGSALLDKSQPIPTELSNSIPPTYVPGRNTVFIALAMSYAEVFGIEKIFIAVNAVDYSGYPDCRPEYIAEINKLSELATKTGAQGRPIKIEAPFVNMAKAEIIKLGFNLSVPYELTWSCYAGGDFPCGECDSCRLRRKGFEDAGKTDPLLSA